MIAPSMRPDAAQEETANTALRARLDQLFRKAAHEDHDGWAMLQLRRHVEAYRLKGKETA